MSPRVAVVIVNYNCLEDLPGCIESILASPEQPEVVVVDNASTDGSVEVIRQRFPSVKIISNDANHGLAAGNNQGIEATTAPFVLMCNPDIRCESVTLGALADCFERHPKAGLVGPRLFDRDGNLRTTVASLPRLRDAVRGRYWWSWWHHDTEREVEQVMEACYAVRRDALADVGPLDPLFFLYWEGADLACRLRKGGWQVWFCPSGVGVHRGGATVDRLPWRRIVWSQRGAYRYFKLHSRIPAPVLVAIFGARTLMKFGVHALHGTQSQVPPVSVDVRCSSE
jgi:hypothetical protein